MSQMSMFDIVNESKPQNIMPETYEDIDSLLAQVKEEETDEDLFSYNETVGGRSYSFYGTKVFEFVPKKGDKGCGKLKVCSEVSSKLGFDEAGKNKPFVSITLNTQDDVNALVDALRTYKRYIFRNLITETFGCCNDFLRCSDAGNCIHQSDRFYNGCIYRRNLEQGKIYYGPKRNVDGEG